jgi:uncharacterized protein (DUF427 family)
MPQAVVDGTVIADSPTTVVVEGNHYFPPSSLRREHYTETDLSTTCPWKGEASYYTLRVGDRVLENAAWTYHQPKEAAAEIADHVAFYPVVEIRP